MGDVVCIACGCKMAGQTGGCKPGVRCPECGEGDAARARPASDRRWGGFAILLCAAGAGLWLLGARLLGVMRLWRISDEAVIWASCEIGLAMAAFLEARRHGGKLGAGCAWVGIVATGWLAAIAALGFAQV